MHMLCIEASRGHSVAAWDTLFKKVPGTPKRVVCDEEGRIRTAAEARWPNIQMTISRRGTLSTARASTSAMQVVTPPITQCASR